MTLKGLCGDDRAARSWTDVCVCVLERACVSVHVCALRTDGRLPDRTAAAARWTGRSWHL